MARPVTLFTGQWADLPLDQLASMATSWGYGGIDWESIFRTLNRIDYDGPLSVEWEDNGMDREYGAQEALAFVRRRAFPPSSRAFDEAFQQ